jgi:hypothetical protein
MPEMSQPAPEVSPASRSISKPKKPFFKRVFFALGADVVLGTLVAAISILTALIAYGSRLADNKASGASSAGDNYMLEYNTDWVLAEQLALRDFLYYDWWYLNLDTNPTLAEYYRSSFSDPLEASVQRVDAGEADYAFDDVYYEDIYAEAMGQYDLGQEQFAIADSYGQQADFLQFSSMVFAVSLALAAWASILKDNNPLRPFFSLFSITIGVIGILLVVSIL